MRSLAIGMMLVIGVTAWSQQQVRGTVTYLAGGNVYTSLGRDAGITDSTDLVVRRGGDSIATIRVFAVSSRSSVARVLVATRAPAVGDDVVGAINPQSLPAIHQNTARTDTVPVRVQNVFIPTAAPRKVSGAVELRGRIGIQYLASLYSNPLYTTRQPGVVVNVRGVLREPPMRFDVYANLRSLSVGRGSPLARGARNQSRIYGLSFTYDDTVNYVSLGRIIPGFSPSLGYVDGILISRKFGDVVVGTSYGLQPDFSLRGVSTDYRKGALFVQYVGASGGSISIAYARTYFRSALDREATSILGNWALVPNLFMYLNGEIDLRRKSGEEFKLAPQLTGLYASLAYRVTSSLALGIGVDASRPFFSYAAVRHLPDSLLFNELRSGVNMNVLWRLPGGLSMYNSYSPRSSQGRFGKEYSNHSSISLVNILSSGISLRSHLNLNASRYTNTVGYGGAAQRMFGELIDVTLRVNRSGYRITNAARRDFSTTFGADVMVFFTRSLSLLASYDRLNGYGVVSNTVFAELSVRF